METQIKERNGVITETFIYFISVVMVFVACYAVMFIKLDISNYFRDAYYILNGFLGYTLIKKSDPNKFKNKNLFWTISTILMYYFFGPLTLCVGIYKTKFFSSIN